MRRILCAMALWTGGCDQRHSQSSFETLTSAEMPPASSLTSGQFVGAPRGTWLPSTVELPKSAVYPESISVGGRVVRVPAPRGLQSAIDNAQDGDILELTPGAAYEGPIVLKARGSAADFVTIRTAPAPGQPPAGSRITPANQASLARIVGPTDKTPVLATQDGAAGYVLRLLEIAANPVLTSGGTLVALGTSTQTSLAQMPRNLVLDRVYVHGTAMLGFQRCIALNSGATAIVDSWISDCHGKGFDSQAIGGWNGSGPYKIVNNYLEGAGENVMFGGSDPQISGVVPSDIEFRRNYVVKPASWQGVWSVKNNLELKLGVRVLIEGNIFENNWVDAQSGFSVLFKSVNQSGGAPWSETRDVTFRYNIIRNVPHAINLAAKPESHPAVPMTKVVIAHNVFERIGSGTFAGGRLWQSADVSDLTFVNNTGFGLTQGLILLGTNVASRLTVESNIFGTSQQYFGTWDFALSGDNAGRGVGALTRYYASSWSFRGNVIPGFTSALYPPENARALSPNDIGFVNYPLDLELDVQQSKFLTRGVNGQIPGVNFSRLREYTQGVDGRAPSPASTSPSRGLPRGGTSTTSRGPRSATAPR